MRKLLHRLIVLTAAIIVPMYGVSAEDYAISDFDSRQGKENDLIQTSTKLQVVLPESAKVTMSTGGSYTGNLASISSESLVLAAGGQSIDIPRSQVSRVDLYGTAWIRNLDGDREAYTIRGLSIPLEDVPTTALTWNGTSSLATLDLQGVLTASELARLTRNSELVYALVRIVSKPSDPENMHIRVKSLRR
ncbi:hypothetical protein [Synechococcus sp. PCC 7335]|uniref:hypothetical protein n=1 Tax=Synechococcus sp. (strain ATCC 29403 / PCC 7335) TaxID=91464 RepID=UPI0012FC4BE0|nr:hypothetical protein [Synechococcus sp. PCC 7335]